MPTLAIVQTKCIACGPSLGLLCMAGRLICGFHVKRENTKEKREPKPKSTLRKWENEKREK